MRIVCIGGGPAGLWGWFQAHAYRFNRDTSTFIVETTESNWRTAGLGYAEQWWPKQCLAGKAQIERMAQRRGDTDYSALI
ncbi:MAG TPA: hypothetical protein VLI93_03275 [Acetobacteraceae bacterium]|nr:hypothetical protein [Acetobacteraceae bacterium]